MSRDRLAGAAWGTDLRRQRDHPTRRCAVCDQSRSRHDSASPNRRRRLGRRAGRICQGSRFTRRDGIRLPRRLVCQFPVWRPIGPCVSWRRIGDRRRPGTAWRRVPDGCGLRLRAGAVRAVAWAGRKSSAGMGVSTRSAPRPW